MQRKIEIDRNKVRQESSNGRIKCAIAIFKKKIFIR